MDEMECVLSLADKVAHFGTSLNISSTTAISTKVTPNLSITSSKASTGCEMSPYTTSIATSPLATASCNNIPNGSVILKHLEKHSNIQLTPKAKNTTKRISGARVLTSAECLKILKEKEDKKKSEMQEKQLRKEKREMNKKKREAEKEHKRKKKEQVKKVSGLGLREARASQKKCMSTLSDTEPTEVPLALQDEIVLDAEGRTQPFSMEQCAVCLEAYSSSDFDCDWIECACGRWTHEDCVDDVVIDINGKERFCPHCVI